MKPITPENYYDYTAISQSLLKRFAESPRLVNKPFGATVSMNLGTCLDLALTDIGVYNSLQVKATKTTKISGHITKDWKQQIDEMIIDLHNYEINLLGKKWRFEELAKKAQKQKIILINDPISDELLKCKPDYYHSKFMIDLKSTVASNIDEFKKQFINLKYYLQASFYTYCHKLINGKDEFVPFFFLAVSTKTGEIFCIETSQEYIELGLEEMHQLINRYVYYRNNNLFKTNQPQVYLKPDQWLINKINNNLGVLS